MRLTVTTPLAIVVETADVAHVRAEDATGGFGILSGHADFLTALTVSVVTWRDRHDAEHHVAVREGMLSVRDGATIAVATREAVTGDDLARLESEVLTRFRQNVADEKAARVDAQRLYLAVMQRILNATRPDRPGPPAMLVTADRLDGIDQ